MSLLQTVLQLLTILWLPPLLLGVINRVKALFAGRRGAPLLQAYFDLAKLLQKGMVQSRTTSWVFLAGPVVSLSATLLAALLVPLGGQRAPIAFEGDFVYFAYALALGRFFTVAAALDTGSAFEGMGGAREVTFSCLGEPAIFFGLFVLARAAGSDSLSDMLGPAVSAGWAQAGAALAAVLASWFVVLLAENSRIPFDDPNTHLELTMIHEVMVLDHGGPALGLVLYGAALKLLVFSALVLGLAAPLWDLGPFLATGGFILASLALAALIGVVESVMARLRLTQVPDLLIAACLLSAFGAILFVR